MSAIARLVAWLSGFLRRLGICGNAGVIVGVLAGSALALLDFVEGGGLVLNDADALRVWLVLALFGWLSLLLVFTAFVRWRLSAVVVPALLNSLLVTAVTVYVSRAMDLYQLALPIGILAGMLIGFLLCTLYNRLVKG